MPAFSARRPAACIDGPSAIGSVNGMPISMMSAPAGGSALTIASEVSGSGSPAITKVTKAERPSRFNWAKRASMRVVMLRNSLLLPPQDIADLRDVLVAATREIDHHQVVLRALRRELHDF